MAAPYPEAACTYWTRSPVDHAEDINAPVLLLQGEDDPVVPFSQAEQIIDTLAENGVTTNHCSQCATRNAIIACE